MLDLIVRGGMLVDGTGAPPRRGDVGIRDGMIVATGVAGDATIDETARRTIDADGLLVCPGFVDPHTHFDAQLFWDPLATPSGLHGVTTVIGGNCGFSFAPLRARDADYTRRMMAKVEGMSLATLEAGLPWDWDGFGDYLDRLDGRVAVNAGFLVGHCAIRRHVLGEDATVRAATSAEVDEMTALLDASLAAGALGLSTTRSPTHNDGDGAPVPSRLADVDELLALCAVVGEHPGTTLEAIIEGCLRRFSDDDAALLSAMSRAARRPVNWNVLGVDATDPDRPAHQMAASDRARREGGRIVALTMPILVPMTMSFHTYSALWLIPGWGEVLDAPVHERTRRLLDPAVRAEMLRSADESPLSYTRFADFTAYVIGDTVHPDNAQYRGRVVGDLARERGVDPFTCVVDILVKDELRTVLWPQPTTDTDADWELRRRLWEHPDALLGGSDAGAHVDRMCGAPYPTRFLADTLRGRQLVSVERAVQLLTDAPAQLLGLRGRGRIAEDHHADLVLVDPETVDAGPPRSVADLPAGSARLVSDPVGVEHVLVAGVEVATAGAGTGAVPGTVLRSGRDTVSVVPAGAPA